METMYYIPEMDVDCNAEKLFKDIRNGYYDDKVVPENLKYFEEFSEIMHKDLPEKEAYVKTYVDELSDPEFGEEHMVPLYDIKRDILENNHFGDEYSNEDTVIDISKEERSERILIVITVYEREIGIVHEFSSLVSLDDFLYFTYKDLDVLIGEIMTLCPDMGE